MSSMSEQIRAVARQYLENGEVSLVIGYEADPRGGAARRISVMRDRGRMALHHRRGAGARRGQPRSIRKQ